MAKYYAVKNGRNIGIFTSWAECKEQVEGFSGAEYKSFPNKTDAKVYLGILDSAPKKRDTKNYPPPNDRIGVENSDTFDTQTEAVAYVDGSYCVHDGRFSFGAVFFHKGRMYTFSHAYTDPDLAAMRNVAGELKGAEFVMKYSLKLGIKSLAIYYDYAGIEQWAIGGWKTNKDGTRAYKRLYDAIKKDLDVTFIKVKGHSGDVYNDMADSLAKAELGIN